MNQRRRFLIALGASALAEPFETFAQKPSKVWRIGILSQSRRPNALDADLVGAFLHGMRELGYAEGSNLAIEFRWAEGRDDRLPALAAELVRLGVEVIVAVGTPSTQAAMKATTTIPVVMLAVGDPIRSKLVASLARPGGNVTGLTQLGAELAGKRLQVLRDMVPKLARVAFLWNPANASHEPYVKDMQAAARKLNLTLQSVEVRKAHEFDSAFSRMMRERPDALIMTADTEHQFRLAWIVAYAAKHRLPVMYQMKENVEAGGLMSYGANHPDLYRRGATYVDKILKGTKPSDLPVEQPMTFELLINSKTAKALGLKIPQSLLIMADKIID
jgi:putative ABC transport system substrate-binding protein